MPSPEPIPPEGVFERRSTRQTGFVFDDFAPDSSWVRETATVQFPPLVELRRLVVVGEFIPHPQASGRESGPPSLTVFLANQKIGTATPTKPGSWEIAFDVPLEIASQGFTLRLALGGVRFTNFLAWAARVFFWLASCEPHSALPPPK